MKPSQIVNLVLFVLLAAGAFAPMSEDARAQADTSPGRGRDTVPPTNTTEWNISGVVEIVGCCTYSGNITIFANGILRIKQESTLTIIANDTQHWTLFVMMGGYVEVTNSSVLNVDRFETESGAGLTVEKGSRVTANGYFNATVSSLTVTDSSIAVTGAAGSAAGENGSSAKLILNAGSGGNIVRSKLTVTGGAGNEGGDGGVGGSGGDATIFITSQQFDMDIVTVQAGAGGKGGKPVTVPNGGAGGRGGALNVKMAGNGFTRSNFSCYAGEGGIGTEGMSSQTGGNAGPGGDGGSAIYEWNGAFMTISSSNLTVAAGNGGKGGMGGTAQTAGKNGGDGGEGGRGGSISAVINNYGPLTISDSDFNFRAGHGPSGGNYGRAGQGGTDGKSGDGGIGGNAVVRINLDDEFTATNASIFTMAGNGGAGGFGSSGGHGGSGGSCNLTINIVAVGVESTFTMRARSVVSRGGDGGEGGKGLSIGQIKGQPGDGGKGGAGRLLVNSQKSMDFTNVEIVADEGIGGVADKPAMTGNPGLGELAFYTGMVTMSNCMVTQTLGPVNGNDKWLVDSTPIKRPLHFVVTESGVAEEYWHLTVKVLDNDGNPVTNAVTVELLRNESLVDSRITDAFSKTEFRLLGARYTVDGVNRMSGYNVVAHDNEGHFWRHYYWESTSDGTISIVMVKTIYEPNIQISAPDPKITPIIDASAFIRENGQTDYYLIEGDAFDNTGNSDPSIERVQLKIGADADWIDLNFTATISGKVKWDFAWDIYNWSVGMLAKYPQGTIPCPIYARSYNGRYWSDDLSLGRYTLANITVRLLRIPPAPPDIEITAPAASSRLNIGEFNATANHDVPFNARAVSLHGTRIIKWVWDFDDSDGFQEDYTHPISPETTHVYPKAKMDSVIRVTLKIYDNESARRVELLRAGVPYDEFGYDFDTNDGSVYVSLRVYVKPISIVEPPVNNVPLSVRLTQFPMPIVYVSLIIGLGVGGYVAGTEVGLWSFFTFLIIPLYTKLKRMEVLDHVTRGKILGFIMASPGSHYNQIKTRLSLNNGTLAYHLRVLEREEYIKSRTDGTLRRFYPKNAKLKPVHNGLSDIQHQILEVIHDNPGITQMDIAGRVDKSQQVVSYNIRAMVRAGLIRAERSGTAILYTVLRDPK
jgi:predicted transcriptional regulator